MYKSLKTLTISKKRSSVHTHITSGHCLEENKTDETVLLNIPAEFVLDQIELKSTRIVQMMKRSIANIRDLLRHHRLDRDQPMRCSEPRLLLPLEETGLLQSVSHWIQYILHWWLNWLSLNKQSFLAFFRRIRCTVDDLLPEISSPIDSRGLFLNQSFEIIECFRF